MIRRFLKSAVLAICLGLALVHPAAAMAGRIVDGATGAPIAGATIVAGGQLVPVDGMGRFTVDTTGPVFARAPGYRAGTFNPAASPPTDAVLRLDPFTPKALYLTVYGIGSSSLRDPALALMREKGLNALVIDVKGDRGLVPFPSATAMTMPGARAITTIPNLAELAATLHVQGIYAIARIVTFKDPLLAASRPDLAVKRGNGELFRDREHLAWTDPLQQVVRDYNIGIAIEAAQAGFDEIQFDYVRFPDANQRLRFAGPTTEKDRLAAIAGFLGEARRRLLPYNVYVAADIFGYVCWNLDDTGIGQRLEELAPQVDYLSPMLYPSGFQFGIPGYRNPVSHSYEIVRLSLENALSRLNISPKRFRPWLQAFKDYAFDRRSFGGGEIRLQTKAADDVGVDGWMLWNPRNVYGDLGVEQQAAR
ncbi:putative glycoside hydrolase [Nitrospirillum amazonense]|uniref:putative glycoside hydrolase n=1 Tax=Nitrospirillum amazonense TaxID=28077 RepID=UPI0024122D7D|nr:putative glycoside hydrolase [Nitrospirillum amazonense]MDG3439067.1 putative glycoside hydrolase [Nitrospirillum amazonense]